MLSYQLAIEVVASSVSFPELVSSQNPPTMYFELAAPGELPAQDWRLIRTVEMEDGRPWMHISRLGDSFRLEFPGHGWFLYCPGAARIEYYASQGDVSQEADLVTVRHLFLDQVLPLVLNQRGQTVLHASAVATPAGAAIAFLGKSGSGKSTLAASLCQQGCSLLADDCLVLDDRRDEFWAVPVYPGLRLWEESTRELDWASRAFPNVASYTEKKRVSVELAGLRYATAAVPLRALYLVNQDWLEVEKLAVSRAGPGEGLIGLVGSSYCLDPENQRRNALDFERLARLSERIPVMHIRYPYDFSQLPAVRDAVLAAQALL